MSHPHPSSMVVTRIGGVDYPMRSVPSCKTCQSPHRLAIENDLVKGLSYASIARSLVDLPGGHLGNPSAEGISDHVRKGHIPVGASAQRRLIERRAKEIGRSIEDSEESLVDYVTVSQMIVARGFERMQGGEIAPDLGDVIAASKFLYQIDQSAEGGMDQEVMLQALHAYMEVARSFIPQERWQEYGALMERHPVLRAIHDQQEAQKQLEAGGED